MNVFFDTEFAGGIEKKDAQRYLISIGLVAMDGREFYAELIGTWDDHLCSPWVLKNVIPLLDGGDCRMGVEEFAVRLKEWIEGLTAEQVIMRSDAPSYDWKFIEEIFSVHGWPKNLRKTCGSIYFESDRQNHRYKAAAADYFKTHGAHQHHSLVDARSVR